MTCFLFIVFFAPNRSVLLVGQILLGFEWGIVSTHSQYTNKHLANSLHSLLQQHRPMPQRCFHCNCACTSRATPTCASSSANSYQAEFFEDLSTEQINGDTAFLTASDCHSVDTDPTLLISVALQWFWPLWLIPTIYFAPESPW
jgi:MFS transporter, SP family, general alpha glucoside:H+ symporter